MSFIESTRPPGVSIRKTSANGCGSALFAWFIRLFTNCAVAGLISVSIGTTQTSLIFCPEDWAKTGVKVKHIRLKTDKSYR